MSDYSFLIKDNHIPDIAYRTDPPHEIVHPRITFKGDIPYVYCQKKPITLESFLYLLATNKKGLRVAAYRLSNKRQTSITFSKENQLTLSSRIQNILERLRAEQMPKLNKSENSERAYEYNFKITDDSENKLTIDSHSDANITIEQLEKKLSLQREIGRIGEDIAYQYEYQRLVNLGCDNPDTCINKLSNTNISAGYDITSTFAGQTRYIEVKSTCTEKDEFYISENERKVLTKLGSEAFIYLIHINKVSHRNSNVREIKNPFSNEHSITLDPVAWFAHFNSR